MRRPFLTKLYGTVPRKQVNRLFVELERIVLNRPTHTAIPVLDIILKTNLFFDLFENAFLKKCVFVLSLQVFKVLFFLQVK